MDFADLIPKNQAVKSLPLQNWHYCGDGFSPPEGPAESYPGCGHMDGGHSNLCYHPQQKIPRAHQ